MNSLFHNQDSPARSAPAGRGRPLVLLLVPKWARAGNMKKQDGGYNG